MSTHTQSECRLGRAALELTSMPPFLLFILSYVMLSYLILSSLIWLGLGLESGQACLPRERACTSRPLDEAMGKAKAKGRRGRDDDDFECAVQALEIDTPAAQPQPQRSAANNDIWPRRGSAGWLHSWLRSWLL